MSASNPTAPIPQSEIWKPVVGYEGHYEVSDAGRVRSVARIVEQPSRRGSIRKRNLKSRMRLAIKDRAGYFRIGLSKGNTPKPLWVHHLVAAAFIGPRPEGLQINHKSGNRADNRALNLEYVTGQENRIHAVNVLGVGRGEKHGMAKLTAEQVHSIHQDRRGGMAAVEIAKRYGIDPSTVRRIVTGRAWRHCL